MGNMRRTRERGERTFCSLFCDNGYAVLLLLLWLLLTNDTDIDMRVREWMDG